MLDAYIIDRIRRERERNRREGVQIPLHIERTPPPVDPRGAPREPVDDRDRGSTVIDFLV